jgi:DNA helicase HerA-like ATPase
MSDGPDQPVGLVLGSEATTSQEFRVVLHEDEYLQLDDLVLVRTLVPKVGEVMTYGIVTETNSRYEGTAFESDTFRVAVEGTLPAEKSRTAAVQVVRVIPEIWIAPDVGEPVYRAVSDERERALYVDEMRSGGRDRALPVGLGRDGELVWADVDFFDGTKGAHMSISGVSGVATKTSYALFFLRCLTAHPEIMGSSSKNLRVLVFNVKGEDLMFLDKPNKNFDAEEAWRALGMDPVPFPSVSFWAPARSAKGSEGIPASLARAEGVSAYRWTPREFIDEGLLHFLFTEQQDVRQQLTFVAERVTRQLQRFARDVAGEPGAIVLRDPYGLQDEPGEVVPLPSEKPVRSLHDLVEAIGEFLEPEDGSDPDPAWSVRTAPGTVGAFMRRLYGAIPRIGGLVRAGGSRRIDRSREAVTVVDIHDLHEAAQRFVVGALIAQVHREKEGKGRFPLTAILLDELNKYAPREGWSPIKDTLIDIAQRGRSLGILLIGAQQSASRVDSDILANASLKLSGRLDAAEAERSEYGWMLPSTRARARLLKPGTMVLSQPSIPAPTVLTFPYPPWATRPEEVAETDDPFEGL